MLVFILGAIFKHDFTLGGSVLNEKKLNVFWQNEKKKRRLQ